MIVIGGFLCQMAFSYQSYCNFLIYAELIYYVRIETTNMSFGTHFNFGVQSEARLFLKMVPIIHRKHVQHELKDFKNEIPCSQ